MNENLDWNVEQKLKQNIMVYIERMWKLYKTHQGTSTDGYIDCPKCNTYRSIEFRNGNWQCLNRECDFIIPNRFIPLSKDRLCELFKLCEDLDFLKKLNY